MSWCTAPTSPAVSDAWVREDPALITYAVMHLTAALSEKSHLSETCACSCSRRFMTAIPVHAVQFDAPGPVKRRHQNTAKPATTSRSNKHDSKGGKQWLFVHDISVAAPRWRWPPY
jgi:hypothetical protein